MTAPRWPSPPSPPLLYSLMAAGQVLSLSEQSVRRLIQARELRAVTVRGRLRIHRDDLEAYAQSLRDQQVDYTLNRPARRKDARGG